MALTLASNVQTESSMEKGPSLVVVVAALVGAIAIACSSSSEQSTFNDTQKNDPNGGGGGGGNLVPTAPLADGSSLHSNVCSPKTPDQFKPTWTPPSRQEACTSDELRAYFEACVPNGASASGCAAFRDAHATCTACLEPTDNSGPIQWYANRVYNTLNVAGCYALVLGATGADSCPAAFNASVECQRSSCDACGISGDSAGFRDCENTAKLGGLCASFENVVKSKCSGLQDPDASTIDCLPRAGEQDVDHFVRVEGIFCGPRGDAASP